MVFRIRERRQYLGLRRMANESTESAGARPYVEGGQLQPLAPRAFDGFPLGLGEGLEGRVVRDHEGDPHLGQQLGYSTVHACKVRKGAAGKEERGGHEPCARKPGERWGVFTELACGQGTQWPGLPQTHLGSEQSRERVPETLFVYTVLHGSSVHCSGHCHSVCYSGAVVL